MSKMDHFLKIANDQSNMRGKTKELTKYAEQGINPCKMCSYAEKCDASKGCVPWYWYFKVHWRNACKKLKEGIK